MTKIIETIKLDIDIKENKPNYIEEKNTDEEKVIEVSSEDVDEMRFIPVILEEYRIIASKKPNFVTVYNEYLKQLIENPYKKYPDSTMKQTVEFLDIKIQEIIESLNIPKIETKSVFELVKVQIEDVPNYFLKNVINRNTFDMNERKAHLIKTIEGMGKEMENNNKQEEPIVETKIKRRLVAAFHIEMDDNKNYAMFRALVEDAETGIFKKERAMIPYDLEIAPDLVSNFFDKFVYKNLIMFDGITTYQKLCKKLKSFDNEMPKITEIENKVLIPVEVHFRAIKEEIDKANEVFDDSLNTKNNKTITFDEFIDIQLDEVSEDDLKNEYGENHWKVGAMIRFMKKAQSKLFS